MSEYNCNTSVQNLGNPTCPSMWGVERRFILAPLTNSDGTANEFANIAAFTKAAIQAKFNETEVLDRWYPSKEISNVEITVGDVVAPADDYGTTFFQKHGSIMLKAFGWNWTNDYIQKLASFNYLENWGVFVVFSTGHIGCLTDAATKLKIKPIPIKSFYVNQIMDGDKVSKALVQWTYDLEGDEVYLRRAIDKADLDFDGLSSTDVYALDDVDLTVTGSSLGSGGTITAYIDGDSNRPVLGLAKTDLVLTDDAGGSETITSLTATANAGEYTAVWTLGADGYVLTGSKSRYSFNTTTFNVSA